MSSTLVLVVTPEERAARDHEGAQIAAQAAELIIQDQLSFEAAVAWLRDVVAPLKRKIAETFRPRIQQAHELHKGLLADEKRFIGPIEDAERLVRRRLTAYEQEQERIRREAEESVRRERERLEAEERARVEAEECRLRAEAEERRLTEAVAAEQSGDISTAERLLAAPVETPIVAPRPVFVASPVVAAPKAEGISFRDSWSADVTDLRQLVRAVAEFRAEITLVQANQQALNQMARALKGAMNVPGVRAVNARTSAIR